MDLFGAVRLRAALSQPLLTGSSLPHRSRSSRITNQYTSLSVVEAKKSNEGSAQLAGTKFSMIVHFDGTDFVGKEEEEVKVLRRKAIGLLADYGPMTINEISQQLHVSPVAAYQAVHPLLVASLAEREADGAIKLTVKVKRE